MEIAVKLKPLTEEQISSVCNYFDTWDKGDYTESQLWCMYWRMKAQWVKLDKAEEYLNKQLKRKQESYRWKKEQEINEHLKVYRQQNYWTDWVYELMRCYNRDDGRQINIWIMEQKNDWVKRTHAVEIEERQNPDYFQEIIKRFNLVID